MRTDYFGKHSLRASRRSGELVSSNYQVGHRFSAPHAIDTLVCFKWLHPGVVEASGNRE
jgi:hypothetical protein